MLSWMCWGMSSSRDRIEFASRRSRISRLRSLKTGAVEIAVVVVVEESSEYVDVVVVFEELLVVRSRRLSLDMRLSMSMVESGSWSISIGVAILKNFLPLILLEICLRLVVYFFVEDFLEILIFWVGRLLSFVEQWCIREEEDENGDDYTYLCGN